MRLFRFLGLCFWLLVWWEGPAWCLEAAPPATSPSCRIGVVDLVTVTCLHPRMALFDFSRVGFFRLPLGLSPSAWEAELKRVQQGEPNRLAAIRRERAELASRVVELEARRSALLQVEGTESGIASHLRGQEVASLTLAVGACRHREEVLRLAGQMPELTLPEETREILDSIEREVLAAIASAAADQGMDVVLNASVPPSGSWPWRPETGPAYGQGLGGLANDLYYAFLTSGADPAAPPIPLLTPARQWLESTRHPGAQDFLPIRPHPLVLSGGIDLTPFVIRRLLESYSCPIGGITVLLKALEGQGREPQDGGNPTR